MKILAALVALEIAGCAIAPYWVKVEGWTPNGSEPTIVELDSYIGITDAGLAAFAERHPDGSCVINLLPAAKSLDRERLLAHERKHCAGWDHPGFHSDFSLDR